MPASSKSIAKIIDTATALEPYGHALPDSVSASELYPLMTSTPFLDSTVAALPDEQRALYDAVRSGPGADRWAKSKLALFLGKVITELARAKRDEQVGLGDIREHLGEGPRADDTMPELALEGLRRVLGPRHELQTQSASAIPDQPNADLTPA